tara:strand:- start:1033 stop:2157 length:1125 start_codon:yes stop_codon:yes gene_type:complete
MSDATRETLPHTNIYTASCLNAAMRCGALYDFIYEKGFVSSRDKPSLEIGTMVHKGLEAYWKLFPLEAAHESMRELKKESLYWDTPEGEISFEKCCLYVAGYYNHWSWKADPSKTGADRYLLEADELLIEDFGPNSLTGKELEDFLEDKRSRVELEFKMNIVGLNFAGKIDAVTKIDGKYAIIEHKTAGSHASNLTSAYWERLPMDVQLTIYREAVRRKYSLDYIPDAYYDVIITTSSEPSQKKPYVRRRKDESDDSLAIRKEANRESKAEYILRIAPEYLSDSIKYRRRLVSVTREEHEERLKELIKMTLLIHCKSGYTSVRNTSSCSDFGGCEFLDVCLGREGLDSPNFRKRETLHPELSIIKQEKEDDDDI